MRARLKLCAALGGIVALGTLSYVDDAKSYDLGVKWEGWYLQIRYPFKVNVNSFMNNLPGLDLTADQVRFWVGFPMGQWRGRSNAILSFEGGETTAGNDPVDCDDGNTNGNVIQAVNGCAFGNQCGRIGAETTYWVDDGGGKVKVGSDVCIFGGAASVTGDDVWAVRASEVANGDRLDLVAALTHELGHAVGLLHSDDSVMDAAGIDVTSTLARYPMGDDVEGVRAIGLENWRRAVYWRELHDNSFDGENSFPHETMVAPKAAIGLNNSGNNMVVVTTVADSGETLRFSKRRTPLADHSWSTTSIGGSTWDSVAVAGRTTGSDKWVIVYNKKRARVGCNDLVVKRTTDDFASFSTVELGTCTKHAPALAWDPISERFILAYVRHSTTKSINDEIHLRTSTDGESWTGSVGIDRYALGGVSLACNTNACMLVYANGGSIEGRLTSQRLDFDSAGAVTVGSYVSTIDKVGLTPTVAFRQTSSDWHVGLPWYGPSSNILQAVANGIYEVWVNNDDNDIPMDSFDSWNLVSGSPSLVGEFALAGAQTEAEGYVFYTKRGSFE